MSAPFVASREFFASVVLILVLFPVCHNQAMAVPQDSDETRQQVDAFRDEVATLMEAGHGEAVIKRLVSIDSQLTDLKTESAAKLGQQILVALGTAGDPVALEHLRSVFESQSLRRHDAAFGISLAALKRPTEDQDWRYLVRSLTIVDGDQAVSVLRALRRFRRRATKPAWIREVILVGLRLPPEGRSAATDLLQFWTQYKPSPGPSGDDALTNYQTWFGQTFPTEPPAALPVDVAGAKWSYCGVAELFSELSDDESVIAAGKVVYAKAGCHKCHRLSDVKQQPLNDQLGPDLTTLGWRRQPKEIVTAILFPSHHLNDEYPVTTVVLKDGRSASGLLLPDSEGGLMVVSSDGTTTRFRKSDLEETVVSSVSSMPAGLLESLSRQEIIALLSLLTLRTGEFELHRRP